MGILIGVFDDDKVVSELLINIKPICQVNFF